jgi:aflatoxin B1 aldehyde reductase
MTRVFTLDDTAAILDTFQKHGHNEIDTARVYGEGSSEEYLGNLDWQKRGLIMDTKLYPTYLRPSMANEHYSHKPKDLRAGLMASLKALKTDKLEIWYLHGPDRETPFKDTLGEVNKLHEEGYFKRFGISNFQSWEVAKICEICEQNGWIKPSVYQGLYNVWHRAVEAELIPCLRHYGLSL